MITLSEELFMPPPEPPKPVVRKRFAPVEHVTVLYYIEGKTYEIKDMLKRHKCKWNPETKIWTIPDLITFNALTSPEMAREHHGFTISDEEIALLKKCRLKYTKY